MSNTPEDVRLIRNGAKLFLFIGSACVVAGLGALFGWAAALLAFGGFLVFAGCVALDAAK